MYTNPFERMRKQKENDEKAKMEAAKEKEKYSKLGAQMGFTQEKGLMPSFIKNIIDDSPKLSVPPFGMSMNNFDTNNSNVSNQPQSSSFGSSMPQTSQRPQNLNQFSPQIPEGSTNQPQSSSFGSSMPQTSQRSQNLNQFSPQIPEGSTNQPQSSSFGSSMPQTSQRPQNLNQFSPQIPGGSTNQHQWSSFGSSMPQTSQRPQNLNQFNDATENLKNNSSQQYMRNSYLNPPENIGVKEPQIEFPKSPLSTINLNSEEKNISKLKNAKQLKLEDLNKIVKRNYMELSDLANNLNNNNTKGQFYMLIGEDVRVHLTTKKFLDKLDLDKNVELDMQEIKLYGSPYLYLLKQIIGYLPEVSLDDKRVLWERTSLFLAATHYGKTGLDIDDLMEELDLFDPIGSIKEEFKAIFEDYNLKEKVIPLTLVGFEEIGFEFITEIIQFVRLLFKKVWQVKFVFEINKSTYQLMQDSEDHHKILDQMDAIVFEKSMEAVVKSVEAEVLDYANISIDNDDLESLTKFDNLFENRFQSSIVENNISQSNNATVQGFEAAWEETEDEIVVPEFFNAPSYDNYDENKNMMENDFSSSSPPSSNYNSFFDETIELQKETKDEYVESAPFVRERPVSMVKSYGVQQQMNPNIDINYKNEDIQDVQSESYFMSKPSFKNETLQNSIADQEVPELDSNIRIRVDLNIKRREEEQKAQEKKEEEQKNIRLSDVEFNPAILADDSNSPIYRRTEPTFNIANSPFARRVVSNDPRSKDEIENGLEKMAQQFSQKQNININDNIHMNNNNNNQSSIKIGGNWTNINRGN
ncbi:hypothetical protein SHELI_v1c10980 [Spiroplasma helicoides]|uniref:Uncharacterized protein n=1 Tax=Spiroplasma helicoides TaxID=216938 RepID=A0A1B3SM89_9MOLU|nr:hypothetical protein [Spiroplasma helicoides]AOG61045.1 hypothetical protein SHELI_v1c10980 [Spiroplasma helicoides]